MVQWDKVRLKDRESEGAFTFQAVLRRNGTIVFGYKDVSGLQLFSLAQLNWNKWNTQVSYVAKMMKALLEKSFKVVIKAEWNQFCANREYFISDSQRKANISLLESKFLLLAFQVPLPVEKINSTEHPVKVGLSDAFMALLSSPQSSGQCDSVKGTIPKLSIPNLHLHERQNNSS